MITTIPPLTIFNWVEQAPTDDSAWQNLDDLLESQPESPEHCLAVCYLIRVGIQDAMEADDGDEIMAIWEWAEMALGSHSQIRQLWALDEVAAHERLQGLSPEQQAAWALARAQAVTELTI